MAADPIVNRLESLNSGDRRDDDLCTMASDLKTDAKAGTPVDEAEAHPGQVAVSQDSWMQRRRWPIFLTVAIMASGMAFMFLWDPLVHHVGNWATGGDLWGIFRGAHYVGWGDLGGIYTNGNGIIAFPGMSVLLAPVAMISGKLHLTESYLPFYLARPTAALLLQPIELLLASTVIFASDRLAERLDVDRSRRAWLCVIVATVAWPTAAVWGHAEDALAVTFALYALAAMLDRRWSAMGWLLGFGIVMQPLVALLLPLLIAATPAGQRALLTARSTVLSIILVGLAFIGDPADTFRSLVDQPTPPSVNHATPWAAIAPRLNFDVRPHRPRLIARSRAWPSSIDQSDHKG